MVFLFEIKEKLLKFIQLIKSDEETFLFYPAFGVSAKPINYAN